MNGILQLVHRALHSDSASDTGWENQEKSSNTAEDISMDYGNVQSNSGKVILTEQENRTKLVAQVAINKLFTEKHFSICRLRDVMDAIGKGSRNSTAYKQLQALHCIDYADIPQELRDQIPHMVNEVLIGDDKPTIAVNNALDGVF